MCWSVLFLCFLSNTHAQTFTGTGSGTAEDPFLIETNADLIKLTASYESWDLHYRLEADLDMDGETFYPIGYELPGSVYKSFSGTFDGNFHTISNLIITANPEQTTIGLGFVGHANNATVKNLGLINVSTPDKSKARVGGIIGLAINTTVVDRCFVLGGTMRGNGHVAGIVGQINGNQVTNCITDVTLITNNWGSDAGIAGDISNMYANSILSQNINLGDQRALIPDANMSSAENINYTGLYALKTSGDFNTNTNVSVLTSLEMTDQSNFPNLDFSESGAWEMRENSYPVLKGFAAEAFSSIKQYPGVPLIVTSDGVNPIEGATVTIESVNYTTNAEGKVTAILEDGTYNYTITADGYQEYSDSFVINEETQTSTITMVADGVTTYSATFTVKNNKSEVVEGATFRLYIADGYDQTETTDENGQVMFDLLVGATYQYSINKELHLETTDQVVVNQDINQEVTLTIDNKKPVAVVNYGRSVESGEVVTLYGLKSYDENEDPLTYLWTAPEGITLASPTSGITTFTVPNVESDTPLAFTLVVNDGENDSDPATVTFTAKNTILHGPNLLTNGGFEEELNVGWEGLDSFTRSEIVADDAKGTNSLKLESTTQLNLIQTNPENFFDLEVGKSYKFTGKIRVDKMTTSVYNLRLMPANDWYDSDNAKLAITRGDLSWGDMSPTLNEWVSFSKILVIDETFKAGAVVGDKVSSRLNIQSSSGTIDELLYLDDLSLAIADAEMTLTAGEDQEVLPGTVVELMASHNSTNDFTYTWSAPEGITLTSTDQKATSFTAPADITEITAYDFTVTATSGNLSYQSSVKVTVLANITASAGTDQSVDAGDLVTLDASATAPESAMLTWTAPEGIELSSLTEKMPTFTAPIVEEVTTLTFTLTAKVGEREASDEVVITVNPSVIPIANAGENQTVFTGTVVTLDASLSESQTENPLTYNWVAPEGITLSDANAVMPTFTAPAVDTEEVLVFKLTVTDGDNISPEVMVSVTVKSSGIYGLELITNGSFEEELTVGWGGVSEYTQSDVVADNAKGTKSLFINNDAKIDFLQTSSDAFFDLKIGTTYKLSGKVRVDQLNVDAITLRLMPSDGWNNENKMNITREGISWGDAVAVTGEWIDFAKEITINESMGGVAGDVINSKLYFQTPDGANAIVYFDDISLVEKSIDFKLSAGEDITVLGGDEVMLKGMHNSSSMFDYTWEAPAGITLSSTDQMSTSFTAPADLTETTTYTVTFTASINGVDISDEVKVTVLPSLTVNAGEDQNVDAGDLVTLSASSNLEQATITWTAPEGITLSDVNAKTPTFTAPIVTEATNFTLTATATSGENTASDEVVITVNPSVIPVADAGENRVAYVGNVVTLDASGSVSQTENPLTYSWTAPEGITLSDANAVMPTFTAPEVEEPTDFTFKLTVSDGDNTSPEVTVTITVKNSKLRGKELIVNGGFEEELTVGWTGVDNYTRSDVVSTDSKGTNSLLINEDNQIDGVRTKNDSYFDLMIGKTYTLSGRFKLDKMDAEVINFRIMPFDGWPAVGKDNYKISFGKVGITWTDYQAIIGEWIYFEKDILIDADFTAEDVNEGDIVSSRLYMQSPDKANISVYFDDISLVENNIAFELNAGDDVTIQQGGSVELTATQNSSEEFTYTWSAPEGITLSTTDGMTTTATATEELTSAKEYTITLTAQNEMFSATDKVIITVTPEVKVNAGDDQEAMSGATVTLDGSNTTPAEATLTWTAPEGITLSDANASMPTFTAPAVTAETTYTFTLKASYLGAEATDEVSVMVYPQLVANAGADIASFVNEIITLDASATVPANATVTWTAPEGITLSDANAVKPTFTAPEVSEETSYTFTLSASYKEMTSTDEVVVTISPNEVPVANAGEDQVVEIGDVVTLDASASTPETVTFEWMAPEGIELSDATVSNPTFTAPEVTVETTFTFVLKVSLGDVVVLDEVDITVNAPEEIPTSIEDARIVVSLYPNPATDQATIELVENAEISILNLAGATVFTQELRTGKHTLDISTYKTGIYIIQVKTSNTLQSVKLIKE
ncbi:hypothetical protein AVL50_19295 [Flammeovirga sp. SJP92]|nr:hypothetical protein AVL50_19295 [Flammeovirga sp. SJP92]